MRKEIEKLAVWYIPAFLLATFAASIWSGILQHSIDSDQLSIGKSVSFVFLVGNIIEMIDNFVVSIWLYHQLKNDEGRKWIWFLFGLVAHFYAAIIFIALKIYEAQKTSNK